MLIPTRSGGISSDRGSLTQHGRWMVQTSGDPGRANHQAFGPSSSRMWRTMKDEPQHLYRRAQGGRQLFNFAALVVRSVGRAMDSSDFARWRTTTIDAESV